MTAVPCCMGVCALLHALNVLCQQEKQLRFETLWPHAAQTHVGTLHKRQCGRPLFLMSSSKRSPQLLTSSLDQPVPSVSQSSLGPDGALSFWRAGFAKKVPSGLTNSLGHEAPTVPTSSLEQAGPCVSQRKHVPRRSFNFEEQLLPRGTRHFHEQLGPRGALSVVDPPGPRGALSFAERLGP